MAFENPLLSRLFDRPAPQEKPERETEAPPPARPDTPAPPPEAAAPQAEAASQPEAPSGPPELQLQPDHPFRRLWSIYNRGNEAAFPPLLRLEGIERFPEEDTKKALSQLHHLVNATAKKRLEAVRPKRGENQEPQPLDLDAQVVVFIPKSGLSAWVLAYPPVGNGKELGPGALAQAMELQRVGFGVDEAMLNSLPQKPDRYFRLFPIAWGQPPVNGMDGSVEDLFPRKMEWELIVDENNRVDYTSLNLFRNVNEGDMICRITLPTPGVPGRSVRDEEIPAKDGHPPHVPNGRNTHLTEDGEALVASITGQVEFSDKNFQVKPVLEIAGDVDFSTGNINFVGNVHVHGDVCNGFTVRAMGSVTVDGVVEACSVEAGCDVVVGLGVQGDSQAVIRAQRNVFAKYLENCCVCVKETLHTDSIINCEVYCDGAVEVRTGRMTVVGGTVRAGQGIKAGTIGSRVECHTNILLGGQPCGEYDRGLLEQEARELKRELKRTERQPESPQKFRQMSKLKVKLLVAQKKLSQLNKKQEEQASKEEKAKPAVRKMVCDYVYPGTNLTIDGVTHQFNRRLHPCAASLVKGEITLV